MNSPRCRDFARALMYAGVSVIIAWLRDGLFASQGPPVPGGVRQRGVPRCVFQIQALEMLQLPFCYDPAGTH